MSIGQFVSRRKLMSVAAAIMGATLLAGCSGAGTASSSSAASASASYETSTSLPPAASSASADV